LGNFAIGIARGIEVWRRISEAVSDGKQGEQIALTGQLIAVS
jgi:hypothetical protein